MYLIYTKFVRYLTFTRRYIYQYFLLLKVWLLIGFPVQTFAHKLLIILDCH